jgi:hypothetical protein
VACGDNNNVAYSCGAATASHRFPEHRIAIAEAKHQAPKGLQERSPLPSEGGKAQDGHPAGLLTYALTNPAPSRSLPVAFARFSAITVAWAVADSHRASQYQMETLIDDGQSASQAALPVTQTSALVTEKNLGQQLTFI